MKCWLPIFETNPYLKNQEGFGTKNMGTLISSNPHVAGSVSPDAIDSSIILNSMSSPMNIFMDGYNSKLSNTLILCQSAEVSIRFNPQAPFLPRARRFQSPFSPMEGDVVSAMVSGRSQGFFQCFPPRFFHVCSSSRSHMINIYINPYEPSLGHDKSQENHIINPYNFLIFGPFLLQDHPVTAGAIEPVLTVEQPRVRIPTSGLWIRQLPYGNQRLIHGREPIRNVLDKQFRWVGRQLQPQNPHRN